MLSRETTFHGSRCAQSLSCIFCWLIICWTDLILLRQIHFGWREGEVSNGERRVASGNGPAGLFFMTDAQQRDLALSRLYLFLITVSGRTFPRSLVAFSNRGRRRRTPSQVSIPLVGNTLESKINRSYFILQCLGLNTFRLQSTGMSPSLRELTKRRGEDLQLGDDQVTAGVAEESLILPGPSQATDTLSAPGLQGSVGDERDLCPWPPAVWEHMLLRQHALSLPEQQLCSNAYRRDVIVHRQGGGGGGKAGLHAARYQAPLLPLGSRMRPEYQRQRDCV